MFRVMEIFYVVVLVAVTYLYTRQKAQYYTSRKGELKILLSVNLTSTNLNFKKT